MAGGLWLDEMFGAGVAHALATRGTTRGLRDELARDAHPGARDSALLAYAVHRQLVLITRNVEDFLRLHELWLVTKDWGFHTRSHAGVLIPVGRVPDFDWTDIVMDVLLHPHCPSLDDQLLIWHVTDRAWMSFHSYSSRRRRPITL